MSKKSVREIRNWLRDEKIPGARTDEKFIRLFLSGCKNDSELAKKKLLNYHEMRRTMKDWFEVRDPQHESIRNLLLMGVMFPLTEKDAQGRTVYIVRATVTNPGVNPMTDVFKLGMMVVDLGMEEEESITRDGVSLVVDLQGARLGHALQMTPGLVKRAVHSWQDCYPIRIIGIDFVNCPRHVNFVLNIFRRFMREKLRKRIRVHGNGDLRLSDYITPKCLPYEYGGSYGPVDAIVQSWADKVLSRRDWFLNKHVIT